MSRKITIATCQHAISSGINNNLEIITKQVIQAKKNKADIVHFAECSLSGYAGIDFTDYKNQNESVLKSAIYKIAATAKAEKISIVLGSHHFVSEHNKPFNSLFLIDKKGLIEQRYDKRFLYGMGAGKEDKYYTPGKEIVTFDMNGVKCGLLICHEWRYTELYREYKNAGVELIFQSFYDRNLSTKEYLKEGIHQRNLLTGTMIGNAANNYLWISASNTSKKESCFPSMVIQPDGRIKNKLQRNRAGVLITEINMDQAFDDPSKYWRNKLLK